jgi:hypothetical protein
MINDTYYSYYLRMSILLFLIYSPLSNNDKIISSSNTICIFLLVKWITDYRKCTISYLECKIRNIPKDEGIVNGILTPILDINKQKNKIFIYVLVTYILFINLNIFF